MNYLSMTYNHVEYSLEMMRRANKLSPQVSKSKGLDNLLQYVGKRISFVLSRADRDGFPSVYYGLLYSVVEYQSYTIITIIEQGWMGERAIYDYGNYIYEFDKLLE